MEIINIEARTFEAMMQGFETFVRKVDKLCEQHVGKELNEWLDNQDVCLILHISPRALQSLRDSGKLAYAQFALDGFELNAIDYLHKPFSYPRFEKAVLKVKELLQLQELSQHSTLQNEEIVVKVEYQNVKISVANIQYIEAMDNYIKIYVADTRPIVSQMNLKKVTELLPSNGFIRVHKSFIVPVHKVARFTKKQLELFSKSTEIPIGRAYANDFMREMMLKDKVIRNKD